MNANDVIEAYVRDVATRLPRRQRNDVAFELRALLREELQDKADAAGHDADVAMALALCNAFGQPADVAARYRPTLHIIDPMDAHLFLRAAIIGVVIIACAGLLGLFRQPPATEPGVVLSAIGGWWVRTLMSSIWWLGLLVLGFGMASWGGRRGQRNRPWAPRDGRLSHANRGALVLGILGILCGVFMLAEPRWILDVFFDGRAAPQAYEALTYTDAFRQRQAPWLFGLLLLYVPLLAVAIVKGHWSAMLRRLEAGWSLALCAVMAWVLLDGPVFSTHASNDLFKLVLVLAIAFVAFDFGIKLYRGIKPKPDLPPRPA